METVSRIQLIKKTEIIKAAIIATVIVGSLLYKLGHILGSVVYQFIN
ncbi:hypothetical protein [Spongiimicrobium salis]